MSALLKAFQAAVTTHKDKFQLIGDCLLVELLPVGEVKSAGGLILSSGGKVSVDGIEMNKPRWVRVLAIGEGYFDDETGADVELNTKPGDICLVGRESVKWFSVFGPVISTDNANLGLCRESDVQLRFSGQDGYDQFFAALAEGLRK